MTTRPPVKAFPWVTLAVTFLLALHWWLAVSATTRFCTTCDEIVHVTGGYSYWKLDDYRMQPENGNLPQRWAALPWLALDSRFPALETQAWRNSDAWTMGHRLFFTNGNPVDYLLLLSRAMMALFSVATGLLIFCWSKRLWGAAGGLFSLTLYVFSPNFLANGPLATSDVTMVFFMLAAVGAYWRHTRTLNWKTWSLSAAVFSLACLAKFSAVLLLPMMMAMIAARCFSPAPIMCSGARPRALDARLVKLRVLLLSTLGQGLVAWIVIWAAYGFRYSAFNPALPPADHFYFPWEVVLATAGRLKPALLFLRHWHLLPEAFIYGFANVLNAAAGRGTFLDGATSNTGWWYFFPYAFLVKTPLPTLLAFLLTGGGIGFFWRFRAKSWRETAGRIRASVEAGCPLLVLFAVYGVSALTSHLNIGLRHILPLYPPLFILAGSLVRKGWRPWRGLLAAALCLWLAVDSFAIRPNYLTYFNPIAGGPSQGYRHLVDSSLDWGQDLPALAAWLHQHRHPREPVFLSYFGLGDPAYYGIDAIPFAPLVTYKPGSWPRFAPGLYCISATALQGPYNEWRGPWTADREYAYQQMLHQFTSAHRPDGTASRGAHTLSFGSAERMLLARMGFYLRLRRPDAVIGHTIFVYRLSAEELHQAVFGNLRDLSAAMDQIERERTAASAP